MITYQCLFLCMTIYDHLPMFVLCMAIYDHLELFVPVYDYI